MGNAANHGSGHAGLQTEQWAPDGGGIAVESEVKFAPDQSISESSFLSNQHILYSWLSQSGSGGSCAEGDSGSWDDGAVIYCYFDFSDKHSVYVPICAPVISMHCLFTGLY